MKAYILSLSVEEKFGGVSIIYVLRTRLSLNFPKQAFVFYVSAVLVF